MVWQVVVWDGRTFCYPGACVEDMTSTALFLSEQHISVSVVVGSRQSQLLKQDSNTPDRQPAGHWEAGNHLCFTPLAIVFCLFMWISDIYANVRSSWKVFCLSRHVPFVDNLTGLSFLNSLDGRMYTDKDTRTIWLRLLSHLSSLVKSFPATAGGGGLIAKRLRRKPHGHVYLIIIIIN